jgi:hypothetical protein
VYQRKKKPWQFRKKPPRRYRKLKGIKKETLKTYGLGMLAAPDGGGAGTDEPLEPDELPALPLDDELDAPPDEDLGGSPQAVNDKPTAASKTSMAM